MWCIDDVGTHDVSDWPHWTPELVRALQELPKLRVVEISVPCTKNTEEAWTAVQGLTGRLPRLRRIAARFAEPVALPTHDGGQRWNISCSAYHVFWERK